MKRNCFFLALIFIFTPLVAAAQNVSPEGAYKLVTQNHDLYLLDVRTPAEYRQARLEGAMLIPIDQLVNRINELPSNRPILVYCAVGSRSAQVVNYLARRGYTEIYNLYGGIYSWAQRGYPVLRGGP